MLQKFSLVSLIWLTFCSAAVAEWKTVGWGSNSSVHVETSSIIPLAPVTGTYLARFQFLESDPSEVGYYEKIEQVDCDRNLYRTRIITAFNASGLMLWQKDLPQSDFTFIPRGTLQEAVTNHVCQVLRPRFGR